MYPCIFFLKDSRIRAVAKKRAVRRRQGNSRNLLRSDAEAALNGARRTIPSHLRHTVRTVILALVMAGLFLGCGSSSPPLTTDAAQAAVEASLGAWLKGGTPQQSGHKDVEMSDPDWRSGYELVGFTTTKLEGEQDKRQVHVTLELQDAKGKAVQRKLSIS